MSRLRVLRHREARYVVQCCTASRLKDRNPTSSVLEAFGATTQSISCRNRVLSTSRLSPTPTLAALTDWPKTWSPRVLTHCLGISELCLTGPCSLVPKGSFCRTIQGRKSPLETYLGEPEGVYGLRCSQGWELTVHMAV